MTTLNMNGWHRIWVFLSVIWIFAVTTVGFIDQPVHEAWYAAPPVSLMSTETLVLLDKGSKEGGVSFQVPGYLATFHLPKGTSEEIQLKVAKELYELSTLEYTKTLVNHWKITAMTAIFPCIFIFLLGLGIAWIRAGFRK